MKHEPTSTAQQLRESGLRITAHRTAALDWLSANPHATADQVYDGVRSRIGSVSKQAVYDLLGACVNARLVRQIKPAGHPTRFERRAGDNHHHVVCRECGRIEDIDCVAEKAPCLSPVHNHGFEIDEAEIVFWGSCRICQAGTTPVIGKV